MPAGDVPAANRKGKNVVCRRITRTSFRRGVSNSPILTLQKEGSMALFTNSSAIIQAGILRTALAASKLKLFKQITAPLSVSTVIGNITECDFDGYGEEAVAAWLTPYLDPDGGASIQSGTKQFVFVDGIPPVTPNIVIGWYVVNSLGALIAAGNFDLPIVMNADNQAIPINVVLNFGKS